MQEFQSPRGDPWLLATLAKPSAEIAQPVRPHCNWYVVIGDAYLPAFFSDGCVYVQAPLPQLVEAITRGISNLLGNLEIGISKAGCATLPLDRFGRPVLGAWLAEPVVVSDGGEQ